MQTLNEQMVSDISSLAFRLDEVRLQMFLEWRQSHRCPVQIAKQTDIEVAISGDKTTDACLRNGLKRHFESLPIPGSLWKYQRWLNEINYTLARPQPSLPRPNSEI